MKNLIEEHSHRFLPYLTSHQIDQKEDKDKAVVILPVASIEQHGPHLPVYTDSIIAQEDLSRALALPPDSLDKPSRRSPDAQEKTRIEYSDFLILNQNAL